MIETKITVKIASYPYSDDTLRHLRKSLERSVHAFIGQDCSIFVDVIQTAMFPKDDEINQQIHSPNIWRGQLEAIERVLNDCSAGLPTRDRALKLLREIRNSLYKELPEGDLP